MRRNSGFTLGELLVSMGLLAGLTLLVMRLVTGGADLWRRGQKVMDLQERGSSVSDLVCADLRQIRGSGEGNRVEGRLLYAPVEFDQLKTPPVKMFRFLRTLRTWELESGPGAEGETESEEEASPFAPAFSPDQAGEDEPKKPEDSGVPGGAALVFYTTGPSIYAGQAGETGVYLSLRRGEFKGHDIGPDNPLFRRKPFAKKKDLIALSESIFDGLLYFDIKLWSQTTTSWEGQPKNGGPEMFWDSTRGGGTMEEGKDPLFTLDLGAYSANWPQDDLFPRLILLELVVELPPREARCALLTTALGEGDKNQIQVDYMERMMLPGDKSGMVKIGSEWISFRSRNSNFLRGIRRGVRGTKPIAHKAGARVHTGWTVKRLITPSQARQWWGPVAPLPAEEQQ